MYVRKSQKSILKNKCMMSLWSGTKKRLKLNASKHNERQGLAMFVMLVPAYIYNTHWFDAESRNVHFMYVRQILAVLELIVCLYFSIWNVRWSVPGKSQYDVNKIAPPAVAGAGAGARESPKYYVLNHHSFLYKFFIFFSWSKLFIFILIKHEFELCIDPILYNFKVKQDRPVQIQTYGI